MANHITHTAGAPAHPPIDPAWQPWSDAWTAHVRPIAGRDDLTVICTPGAGDGSPACFTPADAVIEVDATHLGIDPSTVDPHDTALRPMYAAGWGLLLHEAAHATHTRWDPNSTSEPLAREAATLLEEPRIEARQIRRRPTDQQWLHACTTKIILSDLDPHDTVWTAGVAAALFLARADAGILRPGDVTGVRQQIVKILGRKRLRKLQTLWQRALRTRDDDTAAMLEWGRRWCRALGIRPAGPLPITHISTSQLIAAAQAVLDTIGEAIADHAAAVTAAHEKAKQDAHRRSDEQKQQRTSRRTAEKIFGKPTTADRGRTPQGTHRPPTEDEQTAARQLTRALRAAAYREATPTTITSALPPGRLGTRAALSAAVQRSLGQIPTIQPWTSQARRANPRPPLAVGICTDVSGSMLRFLGPAASAGWIFAHAAGKLPDAVSASVTFGTYVTAVTRPGQPPAQVIDYDFEPHTKGFVTAIDALDHTLSLATRGHAARLLVIISDGEFWPADITAGDQRLRRLARTGCHLLWLGPGRSNTLAGIPLTSLANIADLGATLAKAATAALAAQH